MRCRGIVSFLLCCWGLAGSLAGSAGAVESVRVDASSGAPRIVVDGKPVRARVFFGGSGVQPLLARKPGQPIGFDFSPAVDSTSAAMHFRFGSRVYGRDLRRRAR